MANRTLKFFGKGYAIGGSEPIAITATLNGNVVYTGVIPTVYSGEISRLPQDQVELFSCQVPVEFAGTVAMNIDLDNPVGVSVYFEQIQANYFPKPNPVYSTAEYEVLSDPASTTAQRVAIYEAHAQPPFTSEELAVLNTTDPAQQPERFAILASRGLTINVSTGADGYLTLNSDNQYQDPRSNVAVNGVPLTREAEPLGTWGWMVDFDSEESGTISYDLDIAAGLE